MSRRTVATVIAVPLLVGLWVAAALVPVPYVYGADTTVTWSGTVFNALVRLINPARRSGRLKITYGARVTHLEWSGTHRPAFLTWRSPGRPRQVAFRRART